MLQAVATQDAATIANAIATYAPGVANSTPFTITPKYQVTNQTTTNNSTTNQAPATETAPATEAPAGTTEGTQDAPAI